MILYLQLLLRTLLNAYYTHSMTQTNISRIQQVELKLALDIIFSNTMLLKFWQLRYLEIVSNSDEGKENIPQPIT